MLAIIFGAILALIHYFNKFFYKKFTAGRVSLMSFAGGITISYIFLFLLPEVLETVEHLHKLAFVFVLVGFSVLHLIEKHIWNHPARKAKTELAEAHAIIFFVYYLLIGIILVKLTRTSILMGTIFFIPITFHTILSKISLKEIHVSISEKTIIKVLLSASTLIGVFLAIYINIAPVVYHIFLGFVVGALFYIAIRDMLPIGRKGDPKYFLAGVILYAIFMFLTWTV